MKSGSSAKPYVLDTSAVIAYLAQEAGSDRVRALRRDAALPFLVLTELYDVVCRKHGVALADRTIEEVLSWHLPLLTPDQHLSVAAGVVKARHRLGIADSYVAAFALASNATLITKDNDFRVLAPELKLLYL